MNAEEQKQIQTLIRTSPKTVWGYWPFLLPVLVVLAGAAVQVALLAYFKHKTPDLEVLFKSGNTVQPVYNSQLVKEAVLTAASSITVTWMMFIYLARQSFKSLKLLRTAAKDLHIDTDSLLRRQKERES